jgi:hypothetical protein
MKTAVSDVNYPDQSYGNIHGVIRVLINRVIVSENDRNGIKITPSPAIPARSGNLPRQAAK